MPQRTMRQARQTLDDLAPQLNPEMWRRLNDEVNVAGQAAVQMATRYMDERMHATTEESREVLTGLCEVRDNYAALVKEGELGRLSAKEYGRRLETLRWQQRELERRTQQLMTTAEFLEHVEDDPETWTDETFYSKYPGIRPEFSF